MEARSPALGKKCGGEVGPAEGNTALSFPYPQWKAVTP